MPTGDDAQTLDPAISIRPMAREELDISLDWARAEGWNPGLIDGDAFWAADPEGFIAAERGGAVVGTGSIVRYSPRFGFMGLFIVRPDLRHTGIGRQLWYARRDLLLSRLDPNACIGMDAVETMSDFYAKGGFEVSHRSTRHEGKVAASVPEANLVALKELPFDLVAAFDLAHFGAPRSDFLRLWIDPPGGCGLALLADDGAIAAVGVIRPCMSGGFKIGPLFAETGTAADILFRALASHAKGEMVFLDTPRNNEAALALAHRYAMAEQFSCRRQYFGPPIELPWQRIFGITTFELG